MGSTMLEEPMEINALFLMVHSQVGVLAVYEQRRKINDLKMYRSDDCVIAHGTSFIKFDIHPETMLT